MSKKELDTTRNKPERNELGQLIAGQESLNPDGRPKGTKNLSTLLWEALQQKAKNKDGSKSELSHADLLIARVVKDAIEKGSRVEMVFDRIDGQAKQAIDFTTGGDAISANDIDVAAIAKQVSEQLKRKKT